MILNQVIKKPHIRSADFLIHLKKASRNAVGYFIQPNLSLNGR